MDIIQRKVSQQITELQQRINRFKRKQKELNLDSLKLKRILENKECKQDYTLLIEKLSELYNVNKNNIKIEQVSIETINTVLKVTITKNDKKHVKYCKVITKKQMEAILYTKILKDYKDKDKKDKQNIKIHFLTTDNKFDDSENNEISYFQILDEIRESKEDKKYIEKDFREFLDKLFEIGYEDNDAKNINDLINNCKKYLPEILFFHLSNIYDYGLNNIKNGFLFDPARGGDCIGNPTEYLLYYFYFFSNDKEKEEINKQFLNIYEIYLDANLNSQNYSIFNDLFSNFKNIDTFSFSIYNNYCNSLLDVAMSLDRTTTFSSEYENTLYKKITQLQSYITNNLPSEYKQKELVKKNSIYLYKQLKEKNEININDLKKILNKENNIKINDIIDNKSTYYSIILNKLHKIKDSNKKEY